MELSNDASTATIDLSGALTAEQLEAVIRQLIELRSRMTPAVPRTLPKLSEAPDASAHCLVQEDPDISLALRADGGFRFWLRHSGLGWLAFHLPVRTVVGMRDYISERTREVDRVDLVRKQPTEGNGSH